MKRRTRAIAGLSRIVEGHHYNSNHASGSEEPNSLFILLLKDEIVTNEALFL
jgi:hypothetical protein